MTGGPPVPDEMGKAFYDAAYEDFALLHDWDNSGALPREATLRGLSAALAAAPKEYLLRLALGEEKLVALVQAIDTSSPQWKVRND